MPRSSPGASYGWRARIGMLQPSLAADNNMHEFYLMAPPGVQLVLTSLGMPARDSRPADAAERALDDLDEPIKRLLVRGANVIVQIGIPLITRHGWGYEEKVRERAAKITDVPFAMDVRCSIEAMQALGLGRVGLVGGFQEDMLWEIAGYLKNAGIDAPAVRNIATARGDDQGELPLAVPYHEAKALYRSLRPSKGTSAIQGIWMPGASVPTVGMVQVLEDDIGIPVVSSAQAMMWASLRLAQVNPREVVGYGKLFGA